ncbi:MAG: transporter, partial [Verrucomicrobiota bacterium]|nr:transporter [Verrucomicrobiota bacterium]
MALCTLFASPVWAQTQGSQTTSSSDQSETRPATTTVFGDTGLWFVPTGEVLPKGRWSVSGYRVNWDRKEAFTDVSDFRVTFGYGLSDRVELFGNADLQRRIDADRRPVRAGGTPMDDPHVFQQWGTGFGDVRFGVKANITAPWRQQVAAFAIRAGLKIPTSAEDEGLGTGKLDLFADAIVSGEAGRGIELSGYGGYYHRGDPDEYDLSSGLRWGIGAGFPSRSKLRVTTELTGEMYLDDEIVASGSIDGAPASWEVESPVDFIIGLTYQANNGFFVGYGASYGLNTTNRSDVPGAGFSKPKRFDRWGNQVRIGWHPGVRVYIAPPPPPPPAPPAP